MNRDEFNTAAKEAFGAAVQVGLLDKDWTNEQLMNTAQYAETTHQLKDPSTYKPLTQEEIDEYGEHVWCKDCPCCGEPLHKVFRWGMVNGEGTCSNCENAAFRYYHRVRKHTVIQKFALIGF